MLWSGREDSCFAKDVELAKEHGWSMVRLIYMIALMDGTLDLDILHEATSCEDGRMIFLGGTTTWHRRQSTTQQSPQQHTGSVWE